MSSLNKALQLRFKNRCQEIDYFKKEPQLSQARVFFDLISQAQNTVWGRKYSYQDMLGLDFKELYPFSSLVYLYLPMKIFSLYQSSLSRRKIFYGRAS